MARLPLGKTSGKGLVANRVVLDRDTGVMSCPECGAILNDVRSNPHLGLFWAFLGHVAKHWPTYGPDGRFIADEKPDGKDHLCALMLIEAGHCEPEHIVKAETGAQMEWAIKATEAWMAAERRAGRYGIVTIRDDGIVVKRPASIAFDKLDEKRFCQITDEIFSTVAMKTGIVMEQWKKKPRERK